MAEINAGASLRLPPPPLPSAPATPSPGAAGSAPSTPSTPPAAAAPKEAFQRDAFVGKAPESRTAARAEKAAPARARSAAESVPANRNDHIQQHFDRLRTAREKDLGRPLTRREQSTIRDQATQVADRERTQAANKVRQEMLDRAKASKERIAGQTPEGLIRRAITENPNITNEQILAMARLRADQVASSPDAQRRTLREIPNARELPSHKFTVDMLHALTGIDRETLSRNGPDLGITGSATRVNPFTDRPLVFHVPPHDRERLSTSLHDLTDTMHGAGIGGVNRAVWGSEDTVISAALSTRGVPARFLDQSALTQGDESVRPRR